MIPPGHVPGSRAAVPPGEKSHKERLLAGEPYDACDPELVDDRIACRKLLHQFNTALAYDDVEGRAQVLKQLLGSYDPGGALPIAAGTPSPTHRAEENKRNLACGHYTIRSP
jgi:hypothetical protein